MFSGEPVSTALPAGFEELELPGTILALVTGEEDPALVGTFIGGACGSLIPLLILRGGGIDNALLYGWWPWWFGTWD